VPGDATERESRYRDRGRGLVREAEPGPYSRGPVAEMLERRREAVLPADARRTPASAHHPGYAVTRRVRVLRVDVGDFRLRIFYGVDTRGDEELLLGGDAAAEGFYEHSLARVEQLWRDELAQSGA